MTAAEGLPSPQAACRRGARVLTSRRGLRFPPLHAVSVPTERMNSAFEKRHLWMYLQALGLDPSWVASVGGKMLSQAHLGE